VPPIPENKYLARRVDPIVPQNEIKEKENKDVVETSKSNRDERSRGNKERERLVVFILKFF
jgi:hypothetical protein